MDENESELKALIETGFKNVDARFASVREEMSAFRSSVDTEFTSVHAEAREFRSEVRERMTTLQEDINGAHAQFEEVIDRLKLLNEGECPDLVKRVSALEMRVGTLEKKRRS
jgi:hypothetical protein